MGTDWVASQLNSAVALVMKQNIGVSYMTLGLHGGKAIA